MHRPSQRAQKGHDEGVSQDPIRRRAQDPFEAGQVVGFVGRTQVLHRDDFTFFLVRAGLSRAERVDRRAREHVG